MQLTRFTDYTLRVLIFLARRRGSRTTIRDIAEAHQVSEKHLVKVVHALSKRGFIITVRGKGGGVGLAREAADISIGNVVRDVESFTAAECFVPGYDATCNPQIKLPAGRRHASR